MTDVALTVYFHDAKIGTLEASLKNRKVRFSYTEEIANLKTGSPFLSTALLVQNTAFDSETTRSWFSGLLPEDARLVEISRFFGLESTDWFTVLGQVGWECAGAVSVMPNTVTKRNENCGRIKSISIDELMKRLEALPAHPYDTERVLRVSLGGYQEKLCVILKEQIDFESGYLSIDQAGLPLDGGLTTHILKPQPSRFPHMILGEAWAMRVASCVTKTARTALLDEPCGPAILIVERYDRERDASGQIKRVHQEDCAQALGISPERKYAASGSPKKSDPTYARIASLLRSYATKPQEQLVTLLKQMIVQVIIGNTDAHAKNFGLLHPEESTIKLSPLYDVIPAQEVTPSTLTMGMRIDGRIRIDNLSKENVFNEARSWGLSDAIVKETINESVEKMIRGIEYANDLYPQAADLFSQATLGRLKDKGF